MPLLLNKKIDEFSAYAVWNIQEELTQLPEIANDPIPENLNKIKEAEWVVTRILAKELCAAFDIPYQGVGKEQTGKPFLIGSDAQISISHSFPIAGVMIHLNKPCGIDLEHPREKLITVQDKFLHESEVQFRNDLTALCKIWAAKEVIYKIFGKKYLSFKSDITVKLDDSDIIEGNIIKENEAASLKMYCEEVKNYIIIYGSKI